MSMSATLQGRDAILEALVALAPRQSTSADLAGFIEARGALLVALEACHEPWTTSQREALQQAVAHGHDVLDAARAQRLRLVQQIDALRRTRRELREAATHAPAHWHRLL